MSVSPRLRSLFALAGIVAIYLALVLPTIGHQGIHWDEQTDLEIAESYFVSLGTPLTGSRSDAVNVRLPMFSVAALQLLGVPLDLRTARLASVLVGVLALIGIFAFARIELDDRRGLIAVLLVAVNPYFLAYSPLAFTEGDVFITCTVAWTLAAFAWLWKQPARVRGLLAGLALGLALSSKFSALVLFPTLAIGTWLRADRRPGVQEIARDALPWIAIGLGLVGWIGLEAIATNAILPSWRPGILAPLRTPLARLLLIFGFLAGLAIWSLRRPRAGIGFAATMLFPIAVAGATFFVFPPSHTTNGAIFSALWREMLGAGAGLGLSTATEFLLLHLAVLWIKPSLGIGTALLVGAVVALARWRSRPELRAPLLVVASYGAFLLVLPWAQIRYAMPLLPPLAILASDALAGAFERRRRITAAVAGGMAILCAVDLAFCYPDLNLNGHQWLGTRYWGGRSTLGYRSIGQVGNDGVEQCTSWVSERAAEGETVVTYTLARHVVARARSDPSSARWIDGVQDRDALLEADWVITHLNDDIRGGYGPDDPTGEVFRYPLYDRDILTSKFEKAYTVERRFGVEVAAAWRRR